MALDPEELAKKLKTVFKAKKRNSAIIGTGEDLRPPNFYIKAPKPISILLEGKHWPGNRVFEVSGKPNSGKTTLGMLAMVEAQKGYYDIDLNYIEEPVNIIFIDTENKFSKSRFVSMGGDPKKND